MTSYIYQVVNYDGEEVVLYTTASQAMARKIAKRVKEQDSPYTDVYIKKIEVSDREPEFEWAFWGNPEEGYNSYCSPIGFTQKRSECWVDCGDINYLILATTKTKALRYIKKNYNVVLKLRGDL